jgi:hypothetical protein
MITIMLAESDDMITIMLAESAFLVEGERQQWVPSVAGRQAGGQAADTISTESTTKSVVLKGSHIVSRHSSVRIE